MKQFYLLHYGFETPTPEIMESWGKWFNDIQGCVVDMGRHFSHGREISKDGVRELPLGAGSITGYTVIEAENIDEAEKIARSNPFIESIRVYEAPPNPHDS